MSFLVKVEGSESFEVAKECVRKRKGYYRYSAGFQCKNEGTSGLRWLSLGKSWRLWTGILPTAQESWHYGRLFRRRESGLLQKSDG